MSGTNLTIAYTHVDIRFEDHGTSTLVTVTHRGWAAILLALCGLCHLIPFIFAMICSVLIVMLMPGLTTRVRERIGGERKARVLRLRRPLVVERYQTRFG